MKSLKILMLMLLVSTINYGQCPSPCKDNNGFINQNGTTFSTNQNAQAYYWQICDGDATIIGDNTSQTVMVSEGSGDYSIKLVLFRNGECIEVCRTINTPPPPPCTTCNNLYVSIEGTPYDCETAFAEISCSNPSAISSITWTFEISGNVIGSETSTSTGVSVALPANPNNQWLKTTVTITCNDGTTFTLSDYTFLDCGFLGVAGGPVPRSNNNNQDIIIFPNPIKKSTEISFKGIDVDNIKNIEFFDISGNLKLKVKPQKSNINIEILPAGVYFVKFTTNEGRLIQKKIIIQK